MGRTLKRVPLAFSWPLRKTWPGYINPFYRDHCRECDACRRSGYNSETARLDRNFYASHLPWISDEQRATSWCDKLTLDELQALLDRDRLWVFYRPLKPEGGWDMDVPAPPANEELLARVNAANGPGARCMDSHDAINRWVLVETRAKRLGVYGKCSRCGGSGELWYSPEMQEKSAAWEEEEPPTGEGYQLWETTSEGSPVSPVFATLDELCAWAEDGATTVGSEKTSAVEWKRMLAEDFVCHRVGNNVFI